MARMGIHESRRFVRSALGSVLAVLEGCEVVDDEDTATLTVITATEPDVTRTIVIATAGNEQPPLTDAYVVRDDAGLAGVLAALHVDAVAEEWEPDADPG